MIHHISIAAENPLKVVNVLAEIWKGKVFPFPPTAGGYIMVAFDAQGTAIEVFPQGTTLVPADLHPEIGHDPTATGYVPFHSAISVAADIAAIERVVEREGWKVQVGDRGFFKVVEVWLENKQMLELLPPDFAPAYLNLFTEPQKFEEAIDALQSMYQ